MGRRRSRHAVTYLAATFAALACLYGCSDAPFGASTANGGRHADAATDDHLSGAVTAPAGSQAAATAAARQVLSGLVVPAGARQLPQQPAPAGLSAPALALSAARSADVYRLYRMPMTTEAAAAFLRSHLPAGLVAEGAGQVGSVDSASGTLVISAAPRRLPAGIYAMELVDTIAAAGSGASLVRADVQVIWYPARSGTENSMPGSYRSVRVTMSGFAGAAVTTTSRSVIGTIEALLRELPAAPPLIRSCPAMIVIYQLTLEPAQSGKPAVIVSTGGCEIDNVNVGSRQQPALWDQGDKIFMLARSLLRPQTSRVPRVSPPLSSCKPPEMQTRDGSRSCMGNPAPGPRHPR
jgi:hypothetical protein